MPVTDLVNEAEAARRAVTDNLLWGFQAVRGYSQSVRSESERALRRPMEPGEREATRVSAALFATVCRGIGQPVRRTDASNDEASPMPMRFRLSARPCGVTRSWSVRRAERWRPVRTGGDWLRVRTDRAARVASKGPGSAGKPSGPGPSTPALARSRSWRRVPAWAGSPLPASAGIVPACRPH